MSNEFKEKFNDITSYANKTFNKLMESEQNYIIITFVIIFFILFSLLSWIYIKLSIPSNACKRIQKLYELPNPYRSEEGFLKQQGGVVIPPDTSYNAPRNYHIKTAYNCCCIDGYKNNFVDECALIECIKLGARCLDFEIYSLNNKPVVAASTVHNNDIKETYNEIPFHRILHIIGTDAFDSEKTGCSNDPLYLHFRIKSGNPTIYDSMAESIKKELFNEANSGRQDTMVVSKPSYDYKHFLQDGWENFYQKIIIMCDSPNKNLIRDSKLKDFTNIIAGGEALSVLHFETLQATGKQSNSYLMRSSKNKFYMVLPNLNSKIKNYDVTYPLHNGCQFIAMKFQHFDTNLNSYFKYFKDKGNYAFVLKSNAELLLPTSG